MSQLIECPKCNNRSWSSDYWTCPNCSHSETREWVLLEENKDFKESYDRGDNPTILLNDWMTDQENLTKEMINECLPRNQYNYMVDCSQDLGAGRWGTTEYHENNFNEADLFVKRHEKELIDNRSKRDGFIYYANRRGEIVATKPHQYPIYPNYVLGRWGTPCCPCPRSTKIKISNWVLQREGEYKFDGWGYFPTIPHETAHADPAVHRHPNYQPFSSQYSHGIGHDDIHRAKNREFYDKLASNKYIEKVKERFKELRKIQGKEENKYE